MVMPGGVAIVRNRWWLAFLASVAATLLVAPPAVQAIVNGQPDTTHRNVGALLVDFHDGYGPQEECSGSLIAAHFFLTAAHCVTDVPGVPIPVTDVSVTFDDQVTSRSSLIPAGDIIIDPRYRRVNSDPHDLAVVRLSRDVTGIPLVHLPSPNFRLDQRNLKQDTFTAVGYGESRTGKTGGQNAFVDYGIRQFATQSFLSLQPAWLTLSQNPSTGSGGTCFGDSGGPHFLDVDGIPTEVSMTNLGDNSCRATDKTYRLDTDSARQFWSRFVS
jgi:secreted trypsin-like serine protease